jgi:hypothetical protein
VPDPKNDDAMIAQLRELGEWLDVPAPVDQRAAVRARLEQPGRVDRTRRRVQRWVAAVAAGAVCAVLVVPPARAAVVNAVGGLLRIAGVEIRREPPPGALPTRPAPLPSSTSAALDSARRLAKFTVRTLDVLGTPDDVILAEPDADGAPRVVTLTYRRGTVRLDQFDGELGLGFMKSAPDARWTDIDGRSAIWLPAPHPVTYVDRSGVERTESARLAGPTLVWAGQSVTYRLEGLPTLEEALKVVDSLK